MEVESEDVRLMVRLPKPLRARIQADANTERRSLTQHIVRKLEEAFPENEKAEAASATPA